MAKATPNPVDVLTEAYSLTDEQVATVTTFSPEQVDTLSTLLALPANTPMSRIADVLNTKPKAFRGWARQVRKLGVSGHAGGCDHQVPTTDDFIAMVKRYRKADNA